MTSDPVLPDPVFPDPPPSGPSPGGSRSVLAMDAGELERAAARLDDVAADLRSSPVSAPDTGLSSAASATAVDDLVTLAECVAAYAEECADALGVFRFRIAATDATVPIGVGPLSGQR